MSSSTPIEDRTLGEIVNMVSVNASLLVREEIELAKAETSRKLRQLAGGAAVFAAAGVFFVFAIATGLHALGWLLGEEVFHSTWLGYLVVTGILVLLGIVAGAVALRALKNGAPPVPELAIEEAKRTRAEVEARFR